MKKFLEKWNNDGIEKNNKNQKNNNHLIKIIW